MTNSSAGSPAQQPGSPPGAGRRVRNGLIDRPMAQKYLAELIGTGLLVFFGAGVATVSFGFRGFGSSVAAGILLTGLVFGLVLLGLVAVIGPISSCHVNPAVTLGAFLARRIALVDLLGYWVAQMLGGLLGALLLLWVMHSSPGYSKTKIGLGANGYGGLSLLHSSGGGAFLTEVILTSVFVLVVLAATRKDASAPVAGIVVGLALALVNIMGIPIDGASVNPARSFGPAVLVGGQTLGQLWLFLIAPLVGAVLGVAVYMLFHRVGDDAITAPADDSSTRTATPRPAAGEENARPAPDQPDGPAEPPDQPR
jgi:aquaporin Z